MAKKKSSSIGKVQLSEELKGISSGYGIIDMVSGVPGVLFPRATIVELYGMKSSSKTTLLLETIAFNQMINSNFKVYYADFEKMIRNQAGYLSMLGVDISSDNFEVGEFDTMEDGCDKILDVVRNEHFDLLVVDTVAAMRPKAELEKGFAQSKQIGIKGKLMSELLRNMMADMPKDGPAVVFINQMYKDIQSISFVQQYNTPSSDALAFYAGIRIEVKEKEKLKSKKVNPYTFEEMEIPIGSTVEIKTTKNKVGVPFLKSKYAITYGEGIDIAMSAVAAAQRSGAIWNKGNSKSSFVYLDAHGKEQSAVGIPRLLTKLKNNVDDLVAVGSRINDLWAKDMKYLKQRLERKQINSVFQDQEASEVLDLSEEDLTGEVEGTQEVQEDGEPLSLDDALVVDKEEISSEDSVESVTENTVTPEVGETVEQDIGKSSSSKKKISLHLNS